MGPAPTQPDSGGSPGAARAAGPLVSRVGTAGGAPLCAVLRPLESWAPLSLPHTCLSPAVPTGHRPRVSPLPVAQSRAAPPSKWGSEVTHTSAPRGPDEGGRPPSQAPQGDRQLSLMRGLLPLHPHVGVPCIPAAGLGGKHRCNPRSWQPSPHRVSRGPGRRELRGQVGWQLHPHLQDPGCPFPGTDP